MNGVSQLSRSAWFGPERQPVLLGLVVQLRGGVGVRGELGGRRVGRRDFDVRLGHECERSHRTLHRRWQLTSGLQAAPAARRASWLAGQRYLDPATCAGVTGGSRRDADPWRRWPSSPASRRPATRPATRSAGRIGTGPTCAAGRRRRPRPSLRAARASSVLDGGSLHLGATTSERATRCSRARCGSPRRSRAARVRWSAVWQRAPLQAIARLHALAAADLADDDELGRPRGDADVARRLELLADVMTGATRVPAPVLAAVAHGELLTLAAVRHRRRRGGARGVAADDDRQRPGPARSRRAGGALDAAFRRLPCGGARIRVGDSRRVDGVVGAQQCRHCTPVPGRRLSIARDVA